MTAPKKENMIRTLITIDRETKKAWVKEAKKERVSASAWIRGLIHKALEKKP